jgi:hypothetical protein
MTENRPGGTIADAPEWKALEEHVAEIEET